jgi:hypothetical protein
MKVPCPRLCVGMFGQDLLVNTCSPKAASMAPGALFHTTRQRVVSSFSPNGAQYGSLGQRPRKMNEMFAKPQRGGISRAFDGAPLGLRFFDTPGPGALPQALLSRPFRAEKRFEVLLFWLRPSALVIPRATPPMNPGRISFFVTNFADEIGGNVHVAVLPPQAQLVPTKRHASCKFVSQRFTSSIRPSRIPC